MRAGPLLASRKLATPAALTEVRGQFMLWQGPTAGLLTGTEGGRMIASARFPASGSPLVGGTARVPHQELVPVAKSKPGKRTRTASSKPASAASALVKNLKTKVSEADQNSVRGGLTVRKAGKGQQEY